MKTLFRNALLIVGLSVLITACGDQPAPPPPAVVIPTTTKVLTPANQTALETVQPTNLTFAGAQNFAVGDVLASDVSTNAPDGFLRKVTGVSQVNGKTILETRQAKLNEAIQEGSFDETRAFTNNDIQSASLTPGVRIATRAGNKTFEFNKVIFDKDGNADTTADQVILSGFLDLQTEFKVGGAFHLFSANHFIAKATFTENSNLTLKGKENWLIDKKITVGTIKFPHIRFSIGPVPIDIQPIITLELGVKGSINGEVNISVSQSFQAIAGVEYSGEWRNLSELTNTFTIDSSTLTVAANAKAYADLKFILRFWGLVDVFIQPEVFAEIDAQFPRKPFLKIDGGFGVDAGVAVNLLDLEYSTRIFEKRFPIFQSANNAPKITVVPSTTADLNRIATIFASVSDLEDGTPCCTLNYTSSNPNDGTFDTGINPKKVFTTPGSRTITLTATDSDGVKATATTTVNVVNTAPTVLIGEPSTSSVIYNTASYNFTANGSDINEPNNFLACSSLIWTSSNANDVLGSGCSIDVVFSSEGSRTITVTGTDPQGLSGSKTVSINVLPKPANLPPTVKIINPTPSFILSNTGLITLQATVSDPEGGVVTSEWFAAKQDLNTANPFEANIKLTPDANGQVNLLQVFNLNCTTSGYNLNVRITFIATDPQGNQTPRFFNFNNFACVP